MKFGIFFEMSTPMPFVNGIEKQVFDNALEQARLAEELGFDFVWAVEHHFLEEYSHCSAPEVVLTAVAAQTERIRIGHGAVVCVPEMNHPIRVAERAATLDLISNGRLEVGTARSSTWTELGGFQVDPDDTKKTWDEFVHVLPKLWGPEPVAYAGRCFSMPERNVLPKPLQDPHRVPRRRARAPNSTPRNAASVAWASHRRAMPNRSVERRSTTDVFSRASRSRPRSTIKSPP